MVSDHLFPRPLLPGAGWDPGPGAPVVLAHPYREPWQVLSSENTAQGRGAVHVPRARPSRLPEPASGGLVHPRGEPPRWRVRTERSQLSGGCGKDGASGTRDAPGGSDVRYVATFRVSLTEP